MKPPDLIKIEMRLRLAAQRLGKGRNRELAVDCTAAADLIREHRKNARKP